MHNVYGDVLKGECSVNNQRQMPRLLNFLFPQSQSQQPGGGFLGGLFGQGQGGFPGGQQPPGPPPGFHGGQQPPGPPPGFPGAGPGGPSGPPPGPPPSSPPPEQQIGGVGVLAVDPGALHGCLYRYTFVRLESGRRFWFWPIFIGRTSVAGYRWRPRRREWVYSGFDTRQISSFSCR